MSPQDPKEDQTRGDLQVQFLMTVEATWESEISWTRCWWAKGKTS
jgi:hypothetical protein